MWQQPIYDRTKADVSAGADKCYINAALLNRLEGNSAYLAELLGPKIQTKTWAPTDLLTRSEMERILQNIQTLRDAYYTLPGTPALPETPSTLYSDINTIEQVQCRCTSSGAGTHNTATPAKSAPDRRLE